ncbi:hypothetical protein [Rhodobacter sp. SY28-1]|uniref:hypothetical protein n=1 Tax=Rhodobacter sp. SY28-1 TaxID=2562317 RepID=UPI0010C0BDF7|nr:hypothetical protein [Rhodobacter sp. SY28-1]
MTDPRPAYYPAETESGPTFSVCALVQSQDRFDRLIASFVRLGFTPDRAEFLAADNRAGNRFDGYSWQGPLLAEARGRYVIFCHDDIELIEQGHDDLLALLDDLTGRDPTWLLAGIAGGRFRPDSHSRLMLTFHISDIYGQDRRRGAMPARVETLDECFILMRRVRPVLPSTDLSGFHYYGPDLCLQAELAGGSAWAIDFHLRHHGRGSKGQSFLNCRDRFVAKYARIFPGRSLHCTTGLVTFPADAPTDSAPP